MNDINAPIQIHVAQGEGKTLISTFPQTVKQNLLAGGVHAPEDLVFIGGDEDASQPLCQVPALLPYKEWGEEAVVALRESDVSRCQEIGLDMLRFDPSGDREESRFANFCLAINMHRTGLPGAADHYEAALAGPSTFQALAWSNLGVLQATENSDPVAAEENFGMALAIDQECLAAHVNRYRLASALAASNAPPSPSGRTWAEISDEEGAWLREVSNAAIDALCDDTVIPNYRCMALIPRGYPGLGATLRDPDESRPAAEFLVTAAQSAMQDGDPVAAQVLATQAARMSSGVRGPAGEIQARASKLLREVSDREAAHYTRDLVHEFQAAVHEERFTDARARLAGASSQLDQQAYKRLLASLEEAEAQTIRQHETREASDNVHVWSAIGEPDTSRRLAGLPQSQQFADYLEHGQLLRARELLDVMDGADTDAHDHARKQLDRVTQTTLADQLARLRALLHDDPEDAEQKLAELRARVGRWESLVAFERELCAARHRRAGERALAGGEYADAVKALHQACDLVPDAESLILLLSAELHPGVLPDRIRLDLVERGTRVLGEGDAAARESFGKILGGHGLETHLARLLTLGVTETDPPIS